MSGSIEPSEKIGDQLTVRHEADYAVIRDIVGLTLRGLARDQYLFNSRPSPESGDGLLELRFDGRTILLSLDGDGESVRAEAGELHISPPFTCDDGDISAWERVDLARDPLFGHLIGREVTRVEAIIDAWPEPIGTEVVAGWVVQFVGGDCLAYINFMDDSRILLNQLSIPTAHEIRRRILVVGK